MNRIPEDTKNIEKLLILGTSLFAPEVLDLVEDTGRYEVTGFVENWDRAKIARPLMDRPVIWIDEAGPLAATHKAVCSLGTTHRIHFIHQALALGFQFATIIHPWARISKQSTIDEGSIVGAGVVIGSHTTIGKHVIVNRGCLIGHHTKIGDYVTISPGANIAGAVKIGEETYIGIGAVILDRLTIGRQAVVGAGSVVTRDVSDQVQVLGVPARVSKEGIEGR